MFFVFVSQQWVLFTILTFLCIALMAYESGRAGKAVSVQMIGPMINQQDALVLDVRDEKEYRAGHIVDAINIPYAKLKDRLPDLEKYRERPIIVICKIGQHSGAASKILKGEEFEAYRVTGGMSEWSAAGLPVVS